MTKAIVRYRDDQDLENVIDFVQKKVKEMYVFFVISVPTLDFAQQTQKTDIFLQFQCCGVNSYSDWSNNIYFNLSDHNPSLEAGGVPFSCCKWLKNDVRICKNYLCYPIEFSKFIPNHLR